MPSAGTAFIDVKPDLGTFNRELSGSRFSGIGKKAGLALAAGIGVGLVAVGKLVKESIGAASDLGESINKTEVVFGQSSKTLIQWSEDAANSLGIAQSGALEAAGGFGAMFTAMGMGKAPAADMSQELVELAADMASLHNQDPTEMLDKLRAGMSGEMEPLKRFGIVLSETAVAAEAVNSGIAKQGEELTDIQKIQARYSLLMKQSESAQGDFARTSDSLPNIQRRLNATWTDLTATLGKAFLPVMEDLGKELLDFVNSDGFNDWVKDTAKWIKNELPDAIKTATKFIGFLKDNIKGLGAAVGAIGIARMVSPFARIAASLTTMGSPSTASGLARLGSKAGPLFAIYEGVMLIKDIVDEGDIWGGLTKNLERKAEMATSTLNALGVEVGHLDKDAQNLANTLAGEGIKALVKTDAGFEELKGSTDSWVQSLVAAERKVRNAGGPIRREFQGIEKAVKDIPKVWATRVDANTEAGKRKLEDLQRQLETISSRSWNANLTVSTTGDLRVVRLLTRARGGPVDARTPYLVGEKGPELYVPKAAGDIIPANKTKSMMDSSSGRPVSGTTIHVNFNAPIYGLPNFQRAVEQAFNAIVSQRAGI